MIDVDGGRVLWEIGFRGVEEPVSGVEEMDALLAFDEFRSEGSAGSVGMVPSF